MERKLRSRDRPPPDATAADGGDDDAVVPAADGGDDKRRRRPAPPSSRIGGGGAASQPSCQADRCDSDLTDAKRYYRRHKVCEAHSKAPAAVVAGRRQRFCQQCSRFHELSEFDDAKRSCRTRLAGHNERRRKTAAEPQGQGDGSSSRCRAADHGETVQIGLSGNTAFKHYEIR